MSDGLNADPDAAETEPDLAMADPWASGKQVGRYTLLAALARGGMAEIWLARHSGPQSFEKLLVIKRILTGSEKTAGFVEMFLDEARIAAQLNHPNIVQVSELGKFENSYFMAMEYLHGKSLSALVRATLRLRNEFPLLLAVRIIASAAEGLGHAHVKRDLMGKPLNIVHRDVSPQNILVTYDGFVKVVDFGIAKAANRSTHTATGTMKGKITYMAPEQAMAERDLTASADVFALGVMLFEMVSGTRLYGQSTDMQAFAVLAGEDPFPTARSRNPKVPAELDRIISTAMQRDPAARYQTGREMQQALEEWLHTQRSNPGSIDIEALMKDVMGDRFAARQKQIETAMAGVPVPMAEVSDTESQRRSIPGATPPPQKTIAGVAPAPLSSTRRLLPAFVAVASITALVVIGLIKLTAKPPPLPVASAVAPPTVSPALVLPEPKPLPTTPPQQVVVAEPVAPEPVVPPAPQPPPVLPKPTPQDKPPQVVVANPSSGQPARSGKGKLRLETQPWTQVFFGKQELGDTPVIDVPMPAGTHTLRLVNDEQHIERRIEVEIKPGETTTMRLTL